jgi:hypothetical protein
MKGAEMRDDTIDVTLSCEEWALVSALREVHSNSLKARVAALLRDLLVFLRDPKCAEMQGDGVPCDDVRASCDQCMHVAEMIDSMDRLSR